MTLAARCPSCKTAFKIPDALLQKQNGLVRCAKCSHVFNAYDHAIDLSKVIKTVRKPKPNSSTSIVSAAQTLSADINSNSDSNSNFNMNDGFNDAGRDKNLEAGTDFEDVSQNHTRQSKLAKIQQNFKGQNNPLTEAITFDTSSKTSTNAPTRFNEGADELKKALASLNQSKAYQDTQGVENQINNKHNQDDESTLNQNQTAEETDTLNSSYQEKRSVRKKQPLLQNDQNSSQMPDVEDTPTFEQESALTNHQTNHPDRQETLETTKNLNTDLDLNLNHENITANASSGIFAPAQKSSFSEKINQTIKKVEVLGENFAEKVSGLVYTVEHIFSKKKKENHTQKNLDLVLDSWQKEQKKRNRNLLILSLFFLLLLLGTIFWQRNQIIANVPSTHPLFMKVCESFKCEIKPLEMSNNPVISYSDMQKDMSLASNRYIMNIGLKNKKDLPAAMPFLEISLFDLNEQMIARRIFHPQEFLKAEDWQRVEKTGMSAEEELPVKIRFQIQQAVSSFKVTAFYQ